MLHDKNTIIDDAIIISGSVNWSERAMSSGGTVHIFKAQGSHIIKSAFRQNVKIFVRLDLENSRQYTTCVLCKDKLNKFEEKRGKR